MRKHSTECQRTQIESFIETGMLKKWIANRLMVPPSTMSRKEIKRSLSRTENLNLLNDRPRKVLGYKTPRKVYNTLTAQECTAA